MHLISAKTTCSFKHKIINADVNFTPAPQAMKFASAKKIHWKSCTSTSLASTFHENLEKQHSHARRFAQLFGFPCRSHALISWPMGASKPNCLRKNTGCRNERVRFEKIKENRPNRIISMAGNRSEKCPRSGITLQASALRVMYRSKRDAARQWNSRQRRKFIEFHAQTNRQRWIFMKFLENNISMHCNYLSFSASPHNRML